MKIISVILALLSLTALAGCNTIEGIGKDIKAGGAAIERTADQNKK